MDTSQIIQLIQILLSIIGGSTVLFRIIAPLTETKKDDRVLAFLEKVLKTIALNKDSGKLEIKVK